MKKLFLSVAVLCVTLFVQAKDYADYVSPLVEVHSLPLNSLQEILILPYPVRGV